MTAATDAAAAFPIGARVRVKLSAAFSYKKPWDARFAGGRQGTVVGHRDSWANVRVKWDSARPPKYPHDWTIDHPDTDLELVGDDA